MAKRSITLSAFLSAILISSAVVTSETINSRIVGGTNAEPDYYIYQASIRTNHTNFEHFCGGVIISPEWILTAAQCVYLQFPENFIVVVGSESLSRGGSPFSPLLIYIHPDFNFVTHENDIALVKVSPMRFNSRIRSVSVDSDSSKTDEGYVFTGWGRTSQQGRLSDILQQIKLKTTSIKFCKRAFAFVSDKQICTYNDIGEGPCLEDSGGPLVRVVEDVKKLVGIMSFGKPCAQGVPDVFTRVLPYMDWIRDTCQKCI